MKIKDEVFRNTVEELNIIIGKSGHITDDVNGDCHVEWILSPRTRIYISDTGAKSPNLTIGYIHADEEVNKFVNMISIDIPKDVIIEKAKKMIKIFKFLGTDGDIFDLISLPEENAE